MNACKEKRDREKERYTEIYSASAFVIDLPTFTLQWMMPSKHNHVFHYFDKMFTAF